MNAVAISASIIKTGASPEAIPHAGVKFIRFQLAAVGKNAVLTLPRQFGVNLPGRISTQANRHESGDQSRLSYASDFPAIVCLVKRKTRAHGASRQPLDPSGCRWSSGDGDGVGWGG